MSVSSVNEKKTDPILIEDDNDDDSNDEPEPLQRSAACTFNPNTASSISTCLTFGVIINNEVGLTISSNNNAPTTSKEAERQTEQPAPPKKKNLFATLKNKELLRAKLKASLNKQEYKE